MEGKSLYSHLMDLPKELLIEMLMTDKKVYHKDDSIFNPKVLVYDSGKIISHELKICGGCHSNIDNYSRGDSYCTKCNTQICTKCGHSCGNQCRKCALKILKICEICNRHWANEGLCPTCSKPICSYCRSSGFEYEDGHNHHPPSIYHR